MDIDALVRREREQVYRSANRLFFALLLMQGVGVIVLALLVTPRTWIGRESSVHVHVYAAVVLGSLLAAVPIWFIRTRPTERVTRLVIAVAQALFSSLLIHLTGGRIESHFHIFGSLAFLAFYRDARMLFLAAGIALVDHAVRGSFVPESIFGVSAASQWRWVEHGVWVSLIGFLALLSLFRRPLSYFARKALRRQKGEGG